MSKQRSPDIESTNKEREAETSDQTEKLTSTIVESASQEREDQMSEQTERQTTKVVEPLCSERSDQMSEQLEKQTDAVIDTANKGRARLSHMADEGGGRQCTFGEQTIKRQKLVRCGGIRGAQVQGHR